MVVSMGPISRARPTNAGVFPNPVVVSNDFRSGVPAPGPSNSASQNESLMMCTGVSGSVAKNNTFREYFVSGCGGRGCADEWWLEMGPKFGEIRLASWGCAAPTIGRGEIGEVAARGAADSRGYPSRAARIIELNRKR